MILLGSTSVFIIFTAIAAVGFILMVAGAISGGLFQPGGLHHHADARAHRPSILSSRILSVFVTAFGGFGALSVHHGFGAGVSTAMGLGGGLLVGGIIHVVAGFLYGQQASNQIRTGELVGNTAQVSVGIPTGGVGQVRCTLGDTVVEKVARAADDLEIPVNSLVKITTIVGDVVLVDRAEKSALALDK